MAVQDHEAAARIKSWLTPGPRLREVAAGLLDAVMPPVTLDQAGRSGAAGLAAPGLSLEGWRSLTFLEEPVCDGCGAPFEFAPLDPADRCLGCQARPHRFARARAACLYDEGSRDLILPFKHADRLELAPLFARWLNRAAAPLIETCDAIAPVPLHRLRLLSRRANQAAEIARPLARMAGRAYLPDALVRARATKTQGGRGASGRRRNVSGAFAVPDSRRAQVEGKRILLIDDVLTTGATADACARALLDAGASAVDLAVVARVDRGRDVTR
ncbi:ComF family protein [Brevundimonas sp. 2R-24]|uniref:ComF family protein n=1 Tax=Peiella sedimenti TaxID=3061083 RepID=A0ABT8SN89_9CAUL|nr:ComF family protein [Caulobacteraceae bacterium XZ-24]